MPPSREARKGEDHKRLRDTEAATKSALPLDNSTSQDVPDSDVEEGLSEASGSEVDLESEGEGVSPDESPSEEGEASEEDKDASALDYEEAGLEEESQEEEEEGAPGVSMQLFSKSAKQSLQKPRSATLPDQDQVLTSVSEPS